MLSTTQAAAKLRLSARRVRALAEAGLLQGEQTTSGWIFTEDDIENYRPQKTGRPKKNKLK